MPPSVQIEDLICRIDGVNATEPVGTFINEGATFDSVGICNIQLNNKNEVIEGTFVLQ